MAQVVIADASCLIVLEKIGELDLLHRTLGDVIITPEVQAEFGMALPEWINIQTVRNQKQQNDLLHLLDPGEASSIALALEIAAKCLLIIDEKRGRQVAGELGLATVGTLGILLEAKRIAIIPAIKPFVSRLIEVNFRVSPKLLESIIKQAGE